MYFSTKFVAFAAAALMPLLTSAIQFTNQFNSITSGQTVTLTWSGDNTPVWINLQNGNNINNQNNNGNNNNFVANLGQSVSGTSSIVTIPNVPSGTYSISIRQSGQTAYSNQFQLNGNGQGPQPNNNNNGYNNGQNGQCDSCDDNNNGYNNGGAIETYVQTYVSVGITYTTTTTGPCTTGTYGYNNNNGYTSCFPNVNQVINGITYTSSCTTYGNNNGYNTCNNGFTSVINGITYQPTCTNGVQVINGVTQINDGQVQAGAATTFNPGTATTLPLTGTFTATGTQTGVQSFFGAAPKIPLSAGAAVLAGGLVALIIL